MIVTFTSKKALVANVSRFQQPDASQRYPRLLSKALNYRVECISGAVLPATAAAKASRGSGCKDVLRKWLILHLRTRCVHDRLWPTSSFPPGAISPTEGDSPVSVFSQSHLSAFPEIS